MTGTELSLAEDPGAAAAGLTRGAMWCSEAGCRSRLCSAPRGGDVLAHPASPAADDPDLQLHPGGAVPRRAADEVALPGAVEPDRVAAGHQRDRDGALRRAGKVPVPGRPITVNVGKYLLLRPITNQKCASDAEELGIAQRYVTVH